MVIAPEHPLAQKLAKHNKEIAAYIETAGHKTELERQQEGRQKTGVNTGLFAINNLTDKNCQFGYLILS